MEGILQLEALDRRKRKHIELLKLVRAVKNPELNAMRRYHLVAAVKRRVLNGVILTHYQRGKFRPKIVSGDTDEIDHARVLVGDMVRIKEKTIGTERTVTEFNTKFTALEILIERVEKGIQAQSSMPSVCSESRLLQSESCFSPPGQQQLLALRRKEEEEEGFKEDPCRQGTPSTPMNHIAEVARLFLEGPFADTLKALKTKIEYQERKRGPRRLCSGKGAPDLTERTVRDLVESYRNSIGNMVLILTPKHLNMLVEEFLRLKEPLSMTSGLVLLVMALGKICEHKGKIPDA